MAVSARRCSICGITYPARVRVCRVEACREPTWPLQKDIPDPEWAYLVDHRNKVNAEETEEVAKSIYPHPPSAKVRIFKAHGKLWATHEELLAVGYANLQEDTIIYVNDTFYELQGYADSGAAWWIVEVPTDGEMDSLEPWMFDASET